MHNNVNRKLLQQGCLKEFHVKTIGSWLVLGLEKERGLYNKDTQVKGMELQRERERVLTAKTPKEFLEATGIRDRVFTTGTSDEFPTIQDKRDCWGLGLVRESLYSNDILRILNMLG